MCLKVLWYMRHCVKPISTSPFHDASHYNFLFKSCTLPIKATIFTITTHAILCIIVLYYLSYTLLLHLTACCFAFNALLYCHAYISIGFAFICRLVCIQYIHCQLTFSSHYVPLSFIYSWESYMPASSYSFLSYLASAAWREMLWYLSRVLYDVVRWQLSVVL